MIILILGIIWYIQEICPLEIFFTVDIRMWNRIIYQKLRWKYLTDEINKLVYTIKAGPRDSEQAVY